MCVPGQLGLHKKTNKEGKRKGEKQLSAQLTISPPVERKIFRLMEKVGHGGAC